MQKLKIKFLFCQSLSNVIKWNEHKEDSKLFFSNKFLIFVISLSLSNLLNCLSIKYLSRLFTWEPKGLLTSG